MQSKFCDFVVQHSCGYTTLNIKNEPPIASVHVRNCIYCTVQNLLFAEIVIIPLDIWSSADLGYFNLCMFNFVQVMRPFRKISGEILTKLSRESFVKKIQTFVSKVSRNFRVKF